MLNTDGGSGWVNGKVDPKYTYTCNITLKFPDANREIALKPVKLTVKQNSTKFAAGVKEVSLSTLDGYGRQLFNVTCTDKDGANVADIARAELVSSALADKLEVRSAGSGFAIGWKDNTPGAVKSGTVKLNLYLQGNTGAKPNATLSIKVNIK